MYSIRPVPVQLCSSVSDRARGALAACQPSRTVCYRLWGLELTGLSCFVFILSFNTLTLILTTRSSPCFEIGLCGHCAPDTQIQIHVLRSQIQMDKFCNEYLKCRSRSDLSIQRYSSASQLLNYTASIQILEPQAAHRPTNVNKLSKVGQPFDWNF